MHLKRFFFAYLVVFLSVLFVAVSFFRFVYLNDFIVTYESSCDPDTESCYAGCLDDECSEGYPYKYMQKHATDITNRCDLNDIENCDAAHHCLETDTMCEVSYCAPLEEECFITSSEELDI